MCIDGSDDMKTLNSDGLNGEVYTRRVVVKDSAHINWDVVYDLQGLYYGLVNVTRVPVNRGIEFSWLHISAWSNHMCIDGNDDM